MAPRQRSTQSSSDEASGFGELKSLLAKEVQKEFGDDRKIKKVAGDAIKRVTKCLGERIGSIQDVVDWVSFYKEDEIERIIFKWLSKDLDFPEVLTMKAASTITQFILLKENELRKLHPAAEKKPRMKRESALGKDFDTSPTSFCQGMMKTRSRTETPFQNRARVDDDYEEEIILVEEIVRPIAPVPRARYSKLTMANLKILHDHQYHAFEPTDVPSPPVVALDQDGDDESNDFEFDPIEYPEPQFDDHEQGGDDVEVVDPDSDVEFVSQLTNSDRSSSGVF